MKISFGNMTLEVNVFHITKQPQDDDECVHTYMIDSLVEEEVNLRKNPDSLEYLLQDYDSSDPVEDVTAIFEDPQDRRTKFWQPRFEELPQEREKPKPSSEETPNLKLA